MAATPPRRALFEYALASPRRLAPQEAYTKVTKPAASPRQTSSVASSRFQQVPSVAPPNPSPSVSTTVAEGNGASGARRGGSVSWCMLATHKSQACHAAKVSRTPVPPAPTPPPPAPPQAQTQDDEGNNSLVPGSQPRLLVPNSHTRNLCFASQGCSCRWVTFTFVLRSCWATRAGVASSPRFFDNLSPCHYTPFEPVFGCFSLRATLVLQSSGYLFGAFLSAQSFAAEEAAPTALYG